VQAFYEQLCFIIETSRRTREELNVGGLTALLKIMSTQCLEQVCREAQQVLGGAGYARTGRGARVEQISRDVRVYVVGGGSEEIMVDLAARQEMRDFKQRGQDLATSRL
jgi:alkylation response protein AidB-like acyl-CoA dehydrogenase